MAVEEVAVALIGTETPSLKIVKIVPGVNLFLSRGKSLISPLFPPFT